MILPHSKLQGFELSILLSECLADERGTLTQRQDAIKSQIDTMTQCFFAVVIPRETSSPLQRTTGSLNNDLRDLLTL